MNSQIEAFILTVVEVIRLLLSIIMSKCLLTRINKIFFNLKNALKTSVVDNSGEFFNITQFMMFVGTKIIIY